MYVMHKQTKPHDWMNWIKDTQTQTDLLYFYVADPATCGASDRVLGVLWEQHVYEENYFWAYIFTSILTLNVPDYVVPL